MGWNNLSVSQRAQLINRFRDRGVTDISEMRRQYDMQNPEYTEEEHPFETAPMYASGGKIHINPKNKGKFNALLKRTGKSASWFKEHGTPLQRKRAIFALYARKWKHEDGGPLHSYAEIDPVIVTPDYDYTVFLNSLPDNQKFTPEGDYSTRKYWELNGKPKDFEEAKKLGMYTYDSSDNSYHANSVAWGNDGIGYFMKPNHHNTLKYELDWYNNGVITDVSGKQRKATGKELKEWKNFRDNYYLDTSGEFYRYIPKSQIGSQVNIFKDGGEEDEYYDGSLPTATKTATLPSINTPEGVKIAKNIAQRVISGKQDLNTVPRKYYSYIQGETQGAKPVRDAINTKGVQTALGTLAIPAAITGAAEVLPLLTGEVAGTAQFLGTEVGKQAAKKATVGLISSMAGGTTIDKATATVAPYDTFGQNLVWATGLNPEEYPTLAIGAEFLNPGYGMGAIMEKGATLPAEIQNLLKSIKTSKDIRQGADLLNRWFSRYKGYTPIDITGMSEEDILKAMQERIAQHNTFVRGVRDISDDLLTENYSKEIKATKETLLQELNDLLEKEGIEATPENRMKWAATHAAPETGNGRSGILDTKSGILYTSNSKDVATTYARSNHGNGPITGRGAIIRRKYKLGNNPKLWYKEGDFGIHGAGNYSYPEELAYFEKYGTDVYDDAVKYPQTKAGKKEVQRILDKKASETDYDRVRKIIMEDTSYPEAEKNRFLKFIEDRDPAKFDALAEALWKVGDNNPERYVDKAKKVIEERAKEKVKKDFLSKHLKSKLDSKLLDTVSDSDFIDSGFAGFTTENMFPGELGGNNIQHYALYGTPQEELADFIRWFYPEEYTDLTKNRGHFGRSAPELSQKTRRFGGFKF